ncbi:hypothetical protein [Bacillus sp. 166amftsu]|uniref:hypothetical protein n=1 Tax=Bacillus sp. 166amftsu TaxID=1761753 RepID=UPI00089D2128|nr:hypothetical protein [Bacillus sp. 166amftsu]SDZ40549.1 hypothetical protein SAMN04488156_12822 [Bacillus sp. 166amftsu]
MYITGGYSISPTSFNSFKQAGDKRKIPYFKPSLLGWDKLDRAFRPAQLACIAIGEALKQAKVDWPISEKSDRTALLILTKDSNLAAIENMYSEIQRFGIGKSNPGIFPWTVLNVIGGFASMYFNINGINYTLSNNENSGINSIIFTESLIACRGCDQVIICELELLPDDLFDYIYKTEIQHEFVNAIVIQKEKRDGSGLKLDYENYNPLSKKTILSQIIEDLSTRKDQGV